MSHPEYFGSDVLYKKDSKGRIRMWTVTVEGDADKALLTTVSGLNGGDLSSYRTSFKPSTRDDAFSRAKKIAEGKVKKKLRESYCLTPEEADSRVINIPMKHSTLYVNQLEGKKIRKKMYGQPKLDGVRATFRDGRLWSYEQNPFEKIPLLTLAVRQALEDAPFDMLDGEVYIHGYKLQDIVHFIGSPNLGMNGKRDLQYHVFDIPMRDDTPYQQRLFMLVQWHDGLPYSLKEDIKFVPTVELEPHELKEFFERCVAEGYEGAMVKDMAEAFGWDIRSRKSFKVKPVDDAEFRITKVLHDDIDGLNCIKFQCVTESGVQFEVVPAWDRQRRHGMLADHVVGTKDFVGKLLTVEHRGFTKYGTPFQPVGKEVRDYE